MIAKLRPTACELQLARPLASVDWLSAKKSVFPVVVLKQLKRLSLYLNKVSNYGQGTLGAG